MKKLALPVSGLAMAAGTLVSPNPRWPFPIRMLDRSTLPKKETASIRCRRRCEADPLTRPGATTDPAKIKEIEKSAVPATVVVNPDSGEIVAAKVESSAIGHVIVDLAQPDSIFPTLTK